MNLRRTVYADEKAGCCFSAKGTYTSKRAQRGAPTDSAFSSHADYFRVAGDPGLTFNANGIDCWSAQSGRLYNEVQRGSDYSDLPRGASPMH